MPTAATPPLAARWAALREAEPALRIRNAAQQLGVSEAELLATQLGAQATRLAGPWQTLLSRLPYLGEIMALTRNEAVVIEKDGTCPAPTFFGEAAKAIGQVVGTQIDLRIFLSVWHFGFAVVQPDAPRLTHSLQFFDEYGDAVFKVYLERNGSIPAFDALVNEFRNEDQLAENLTFLPRPATPAFKENPLPDAQGFLDAWGRLLDTHNFFQLLRSYDLPRRQAVRLAQGRFAWQVSPAVVRTVLQAAKDTGLSIMAFVGNRGCIEIHTGPVKHLKEMGPWFNVLDPGFNLHINEQLLAEAYVVEKPTSDGIVSAVEVYDAQHELVLQFFGERKPGKPELQGWRDIIAQLKTGAVSSW